MKEKFATCTSCSGPLTVRQTMGLTAHSCNGRWVFVNPGAKKTAPVGYHTREIKRGVFGEISKIREELEELEDAAEQDNKIMVGCELSDLYGALRGFAEHAGYDMEDLKKMADLSKQVFESGHRKSRD